MGRRIQKQVSTNNGSYVGEYTNKYAYDGWNCVATMNPLFTLSNTFLWGSDLSGSLQGAGGVGGLLKVAYYGATATNAFVAYDGNGNLSALISAANGAAVANYEYGPFGELLRATGPMAKLNPFRFSTKFDDDESDLLYYGYRYYNPSMGRWANRDPKEEEGGLNLYEFACNGPGNFIDLLGLDWLISRSGSPQANASCMCGDTWDELARQIRMDTSDYQKWANTSDPEPVPGKIYKIPNTIMYEYGEYGFTPIIWIWRHIAAGEQADYEAQGYNVIVVDPTSSGQIKAHMKSGSLYGMVYIGHGDADGGAVLDPNDLDYIKPDRYTSYGISFLNLKACESADTVQ